MTKVQACQLIRDCMVMEFEETAVTGRTVRNAAPVTVAPRRPPTDEEREAEWREIVEMEREFPNCFAVGIRPGGSGAVRRKSKSVSTKAARKKRPAPAA